MLLWMSTLMNSVSSMMKPTTVLWSVISSLVLWSASVMRSPSAARSTLIINSFCSPLFCFQTNKNKTKIIKASFFLIQSMLWKQMKSNSDTVKSTYDSECHKTYFFGVGRNNTVNLIIERCLSESEHSRKLSNQLKSITQAYDIGRLTQI